MGGKEGFRGWGREVKEGSPPGFLHHCSSTKVPFYVSTHLEHGILSYKSSENSGFHSIESRCKF